MARETTLEHAALPAKWLQSTCLPVPRSTSVRGTIQATLRLFDQLEEGDHGLQARPADARRRRCLRPLLRRIPGIHWVLAYMIAAGIGDIGPFPSPAKFAGYSGLCPRVHHSGESDRAG
jgi:transposase